LLNGQCDIDHKQKERNMTEGSGSKKRNRSSGIGRIVSGTSRGSNTARAALDLVKRWQAAAVTEKDRDDLSAIIEGLDSVLAASASVVNVARDMECRGWKPSDARPSSVAVGHPMVMKASEAPQYGIAAGQVVSVQGKGPARGVVWITTEDNRRVLVAKTALERAASPA
jgi:hypothetical protein